VTNGTRGFPSRASHGRRRGGRIRRGPQNALVDGSLGRKINVQETKFQVLLMVRRVPGNMERSLSVVRKSGGESCGIMGTGQVSNSAQRTWSKERRLRDSSRPVLPWDNNSVVEWPWVGETAAPRETRDRIPTRRRGRPNVASVPAPGVGGPEFARTFAFSGDATRRTSRLLRICCVGLGCRQKNQRSST
jgi:acetolactate synthase regulatory subunit